MSAAGPFSGDADQAVEVIVTEYGTRESLGPAPTPEEYYERFPAYADRLRRLFGVDDLLKDGFDDSSPMTPPPVPAGLPPRIGRYEIREVIGIGGAGVVYRAYDATVRRDVAAGPAARNGPRRESSG